MDALAVRGDEGRLYDSDMLRRVVKHALTRRFPNGETRPGSFLVNPKGWRTRRTETSQYPQESKSTETPKVAASEMGLAQTLYV